jgi:Ser/Thr protein kinase RdoA (MazF antagonist)
VSGEKKMQTIEIRSSLLTNRTIEFLLSSYEVDHILKCQFLSRGLNDTYSIHTRTNKYIFRIYRKGWREKSDILFELEAINHLSENGCLVSTPITRKDGEWLTEIPTPEGVRYGVLFTFSAGERPEITKENTYLIGKALGQIHHATNLFKPTNERHFELNLEHLIEQPMKIIKPILFDLNPSQAGYLCQIIDDIEAELDLTNLEYGFCHGDFHNFNMHVMDHRIEAFDFDCCGMGFRPYDLAVFWWNLKNNYPHLEAPCWEEFVNGYVSQRSISQENVESLLTFVSLRRIWFLATLLQNDDIWGTQWLNTKMIDTFMSQLEKDLS